MNEAVESNVAAARNIFQRINAVREKNDFIKKTKEITGAGTYKVVTHDEVTRELRDDLIKEGIVIVPSVESDPRVQQDTGMVMGSKSIPMIRFEAVYAVAFVNVDDPSDRVVMRVAAHAIDSGDKAPGKAASYATKTAMLKMFSIVTGENEEERTEKDAETGIGENGLNYWRKKIEEVKTAEDGERVWRDIVKACREKNDERGVTVLRTHLTVTMTKKGIKSKPTTTRRSS